MRLNLVLAFALIGAGWGLPLLAHGVELEHRQVSSVEIVARFDSGEPMAQAQVLVYAAGNPSEVWQQGTTDDQGRFSFVPDATLPGNWEVMVRQAGHGAIATIPVGAASAAPANGSEPDMTPGVEVGSAPNSLISPSTTLSPVQRGITIGSVIWGLIGTGLFFARGKR
jgi:nickel transport protein